MRDNGKSTGDDETSRPYKGKIVEAEDVLGAQVDAEPLASAPAELSIEPLDGQSTARAVKAAARTSAIELKEPLDPQSPQIAAAADRSSDQRIGEQEQPVANTVSTANPRRGFSVRSLDPLFYLIVGVAAIGLFACLYALITQNDAYFEREYQQLQKESAALQARLAASARLDAALAAAASSRSVPPVSNTENSVEQSTPLEPVIQSVEVANDQKTVVQKYPSIAVMAESQTIIDEVSVDPGDDPVISAPQKQVEVRDSIPDPMLSLLQQEVEKLREAMTSQSQKISQLEQDNLELTTIVNQPRPVEPNISLAASNSKEPQVAVVEKATIQIDEAPVVAVHEDRPSTVVKAVALDLPLPGAETGMADLVQQGYMAYQARDLDSAARFYTKALEFDPYNRDANLGVAATAQANGDVRLAEDRYRHLLTLDPADEVAFSALLNLAGVSAQGSIIEYELTQHAEYVRDPQNLYAILGNYYSQKRRWSDAERAYAIAIRSSVRNPDYLFNYAVALDNMGRQPEAVEYYSQALVVTEGSSRSFDVEAARQRLQSLLNGG